MKDFAKRRKNFAEIIVFLKSTKFLKFVLFLQTFDYIIKQIPVDFWFFQDHEDGKDHFNLKEIVTVLNKFETTKNFIEKFFILEMSVNQLRLEMMKFQKNIGNDIESKEILNALIIGLLLNSNLTWPMAHLIMTDDYISLCKEYEREKDVILKYKVLDNFKHFKIKIIYLKISIQYIVEELNL